MIWIAPHWDDILLSLPNRLVSGTMADDTILVVFSDENKQMEALSRHYHTKYGVRQVALGFVEAGKRGETIRDIIQTQRKSTQFPAPSEDLLNTLTQCHLFQQAEIAVNRTAVHLDHALTRVAVDTVAFTAGRKVLYYSDQPYHLFWPGDDQLLPVPSDPLVRDAPNEVSEMLSDFIPFVGARTVKRLMDRVRTDTRFEPLLFDPQNQPSRGLGSGEADQ